MALLSEDSSQDSHQLLSQWESNLDSSVSCLPLTSTAFQDNKLQVEAVGQHTENKNTAVLKRAHAKAFAQHSPSKAGE